MRKAWVKNVYRVCVDGAVNGAKSYTAAPSSPTYTDTMRVKPTHFTHVIDTFPPTIYTAFSELLPLKLSYFSPLSTVPTITKMNKK